MDHKSFDIATIFCYDGQRYLKFGLMHTNFDLCRGFFYSIEKSHLSLVP